MKTRYRPQDLLMQDGMVAHVLDNGSVFVHLDNDERIYVPSKQVENEDIETGDGLRCWCLPNDPEHAHTAEWKSIRCMVTNRLMPKREKPKPALRVAPRPPATIDPIPMVSPASPEGGAEPIVMLDRVTVPQPEDAPAPAPVALQGIPLMDLVDDIMNTPKAFSSKDIYVEVCKRHPKGWKDPMLQTRIIQSCITLADKGDIATAKLYSATRQTHATAVIYARNMDLLTMIMKGELK